MLVQPGKSSTPIGDGYPFAPRLDPKRCLLRKPARAVSTGHTLTVRMVPSTHLFPVEDLGLYGWSFHVARNCCIYISFLQVCVSVLTYLWLPGIFLGRCVKAKYVSRDTSKMLHMYLMKRMHNTVSRRGDFVHMHLYLPCFPGIFVS